MNSGLPCALAGTQSVETNIQGVQGEVEKQAQKLETNLKEGFESIGGYLQEVVRLQLQWAKVGHR